MMYEMRTRNMGSSTWNAWCTVPPEAADWVLTTSREIPDNLEVRPTYPALPTLAEFFEAALAAGVVNEKVENAGYGESFWLTHDRVDQNLTAQLKALAAKLGITE